MSQKDRFYFRRPEVIRATQKREKEPLRLNVKPFRSIFYVILVAGLCYVVIFSNIFSVSSVEIEGVKSVEISDHINQTLIGRNILLMRTGKYLRDLAKTFPILEEATLVRGLPSTIRISIRERSQVLVLCSQNGCWEVDSRGFAYRQVDRPTDKVVLIDEKNIKINETDKLFSDAFIRFYLDAIDSLNDLKLDIKEARMDETSFKIKLQTGEGWYVVLDSSGSFENQISAVRQVLEKNKPDIHEYVDVRVEGIAYVK